MKLVAWLVDSPGLGNQSSFSSLKINFGVSMSGVRGSAGQWGSNYRHTSSGFLLLPTYERPIHRPNECIHEDWHCLFDQNEIVQSGDEATEISSEVLLL